MSKAGLDDVMDALPKKRSAEGVPLGDRVSVTDLPDGRRVADLSRDELAKALAKLKIAGVAPENTAEANVALYERHLQRMFDDAGSDAIVAFLFGEHGDEQDRDEERED